MNDNVKIKAEELIRTILDSEEYKTMSITDNA